MTRSAAPAGALMAAASLSRGAAFVPANVVTPPSAQTQRGSFTTSVINAQPMSSRRIHATWLMAIKGVQTFDATFELPQETLDLLEAYLRHPDMLAEVTKQYKCETAEYGGKMFQPVPYSSETPHGMPAEFEEYHMKPEYAICNVPPVIMFKAKVFKPSRLCALYKITGLSEEGLQRIRDQRDREERNEVRKKEESELTSEWDDIGSAFRDVFKGSAAYDDEDINLDDYVV